MRSWPGPRSLIVLPPPDWSNLEKAPQPAQLSGYLAPAMTLARNEWQTGSQNRNVQLPCYVAMLFIDSVPSSSQLAFIAATASATAPNTVYLRFGNELETKSAETIANYTVPAGLTVQKAKLSSERTVVKLTLSGDVTVGTTQVTVSQNLQSRWPAT